MRPWRGFTRNLRTSIQELCADATIDLRAAFGQKQPVRFNISIDKWFAKKVTVRVKWLEVVIPAR